MSNNLPNSIHIAFPEFEIIVSECVQKSLDLYFFAYLDDVFNTLEWFGIGGAF